MYVPSKFKFTSTRNPAFDYEAERKEDGTYDVTIVGYTQQWNFTAERVQNDLEEGIWTITENLMVQEYRFECDNNFYVANLEGNQYRITNIGSGWVSNYLWTTEEILKYNGEPVAKKQEEPVANGVDAEGNPFDFPAEDFQPFQRVVLRNGMLKMVTIDSEGDMFLVSGSGEWQRASVDSGFNEEFDVVEVYAQPSYAYQTPSFAYKGDLLWKRTDPATEARKKEIEEQIAALQTELAELN